MGGETGADPAVIAGTREAGLPNHLRRPLQPPIPCHAAHRHRKRPPRRPPAIAPEAAPVAAAGVAQPRLRTGLICRRPGPAARRPETPPVILDRGGRLEGRSGGTGVQQGHKKCREDAIRGLGPGSPAGGEGPRNPF